MSRESAKRACVTGRRNHLAVLVVMMGALGIAAAGCGGGGDDPPPPPTYTIGGTVSGMNGSGLVLQNNGGDNRAIAANGPFTFATALADGAAYNVTVFTQPGGDNCTLNNASGTVSGANVTNVTVTCTAIATPVSGTVYGPGGSLAFNSPGWLRRWFAGLFGARADAAIAGLLPVGAGIPVNLIEINAGGSQVGATMASTTTNATGGFTLYALLGFVPESRFVVRAEGAGGNLDAIVTSASGLVVDPISHVTKTRMNSLVTNLSAVTTQEVLILRDEVAESAQDVDPTGLTLSALVSQLTTAASNDIGLTQMFVSAAAPYDICGQVTHQGNPHAGIDIVVRNYGDNLLRAKAVTDATGNYCASVHSGSYIVGALNSTSTSYAASEWWSSSGTTYNQEEAGLVLVATGATANFVLETGGRIEGTATASGGTMSGQPLEAIQVTAHDYRTGATMGSVLTDANGVYRLNLIPGADGYQISIHNRTWRPYASFHYNGTAAGTNNARESLAVNVAASATQALNFALTPGNRLVTQVLSQPAGGLPVMYTRVRVNISYAANPYSKTGVAARLRTDASGTVRTWLKPDTYTVQTFGQTGPADLTGGNQSLTFNAQVGWLQAALRDSGANAVRHASVFLYDLAGDFVSQENTDGYGNLTLYAATTGNYLMEVRIDEAKPYASVIYNNKLSLFAGTDGIAGDPVAVTVGAINGLGNITLPAAGVLKGTVTYTGGAPAGGAAIQVRYGGTTGNDRFINVNARGDGKYEVSLPAATYARVRGGGNTGTNADGVVVSAGGETIADFTLP